MSEIVRDDEGPNIEASTDIDCVDVLPMITIQSDPMKPSKNELTGSAKTAS